MKKFDPEKYTTKNLLGITPENFKLIYLPIFTSIILFIIGAVLFSITDNTKLFKVIFGLSQLVLALSGLGQIKLKEVPGYPALRGGCAIIFGIFFLILFMFFGIGLVFLEE